MAESENALHSRTYKIKRYNINVETPALGQQPFYPALATRERLGCSSTLQVLMHQYLKV